MGTLAYRKPRRPVAEAVVGRIVELRDSGATWQAIGRELHMQDARLKALYDRAKQTPACTAGAAGAAGAATA